MSTWSFLVILIPLPSVFPTPFFSELPLLLTNNTDVAKSSDHFLAFFLLGLFEIFSKKLLTWVLYQLGFLVCNESIYPHLPSSKWKVHKALLTWIPMVYTLRVFTTLHNAVSSSVCWNWWLFLLNRICLKWWNVNSEIRLQKSVTSIM